MTTPTDYKKLAEHTRDTHALMHRVDDFDKCDDEECRLARAVLALDAENQRLRAALREIIPAFNTARIIMDSREARKEAGEICERAREALERKP